jgi:hypothetical protein
MWQPGKGAGAAWSVEGLDPPYTLEDGVLRDADGVEITFRHAAQKKGSGANPKDVADSSQSKSDGAGDSADEELIKDGCHRFWMALEHFGDAFIQDKIGPLLLSVGGEPINLARLQRYRAVLDVLCVVCFPLCCERCAVLCWS